MGGGFMAAGQGMGPPSYPHMAPPPPPPPQQQQQQQQVRGCCKFGRHGVGGGCVSL